MKILFLSDDFPPQSFGGAGISTFELAQGMKKAGHEVSVITTTRNKDEPVESEYEGLKVYRIYSNYDERWRAYKGLYNSRVVDEVRRILVETKPDIVHANNIHAHISYYCLKLAKRYAKGVIFTARDTMTISYGKLATQRYLETLSGRLTTLDHFRAARKRWNPLRNIIIRYLLSFANERLAISKSLRNALLDNGLRDFKVIYNGIDPNGWVTDDKEVEKFRVNHSLMGKKVIFFSGRLSDLKGGNKAVQSIISVKREVPNVVLLVASREDKYALDVLEHAKKLGVDENIIFTGWMSRESIKLAYAASSLVLMPSIYLDAFGRVNIEAMISKKPVVGTKFGGTPEIVLDGVTGYIVNPLHTEEMAERCIELLKDEDKSRRFGEAGFERVRKLFNLEDKVREYLKLYESCLKAS